MYLLSEVDKYQYKKDTYVLDVEPISSGLAVIATDQTLALFDPLQLSKGPKQGHLTPHGNITDCKVFDAPGSTVATAGENGTVTLWDLRDGTTRSQVWAQKTGSGNASIASLACENRSNSIAVGTEYADYKASIMIWDIRAGEAPRVQYDEVHSDDITELRYHPEHAHILLSGSTDGLVNVCDTTISDEDEVVIQAFNHGSVHHAGFLTNTEVFALSHDEKFALYDMAEEQEKGTATVDFGDMRTVLGCQYIANVFPKLNNAGAIIGAGSHDQQNFQLIHMAKNPDWTLESGSVVGLPGAHGSEIVRAFCFLDEEKVVYTGGEDGQIKAWRPS